MSPMIRPYSQRITRIEISAIKQMALKAMAYMDVISFGWGVPSFPSHDGIRQAVRDAFVNDPHLDKYAPVPGLAALREKIAAQWPRQFGYDISYREVVITVGAMEAMMGLMFTLFDPGDEVLVMDPGFASHIEEMEVSGVVPSYVPLNEEKGWRFTERALRSALSPRSKGIILINPHNPTGRVFSRDDIECIGRVVRERNLWFILDEPYENMRFGKTPLFHPLFLPELRNHVIDVRSFSKKYSMTGWRVGYFVASEALIAQFLKFHDNTVVSAPRISQIAALRALDIPDNALREELLALDARRRLMCQWLDRLSDLFSYVPPTGAYYVFPKIAAKGYEDDYEVALRLLDEVRVITIPGHAFGPAGKGHLRLCFSGSEGEIEEGFQRIRKWWEKEKNGRT